MSKAEQQKANGSGTENGKYFSKEEIADLRGYYRALTYSILFLGDSDLRRITEEDRLLVVQKLKLATSSERKSFNSKDTTEAFEAFESIINGKKKHSVLSKVYALMAYVDLASEFGNWSKNFQGVLNAIQEEPDLRNKIIMAGALYSRAGYHWSGKEHTSKIYHDLEKTLTGSVTNKRQAENKLGIHVVAALLAELKEKDMLFLQLPWVVLTKGAAQESDWQSPGEGYPDRTIYLSNLYTPSFEKMEEAVVHGIPDNLLRINVRRIQRLMVGVETTGTLEGEDTVSSGVGRINIQKRRFYHISVRPIRKPVTPADEAFISEQDLKREEVVMNASFDSLTFILSIKLSRELRDDFKMIDTPDENPLFNTLEAKARRDKRKEAAVVRQVSKIIERISQPLVTRKSDNKKMSVLSLATEESHIIDGQENWNENNVAKYLERTIKAIVLKDVVGTLKVREDAEIADIYMSHIWKNEISTNEKLQMAKALLRDPEHPIWKKIPPTFHVSFVDFAHKKQPLNENLIQYICRIIVKDYLVLHCETIRDTYEPQGMANAIERIIVSNETQ